MEKYFGRINVVACIMLSCILGACASGGNRSGYVPADKVGPVGAPVETQDIISCAEELSRDLLETSVVAAAEPYCRIALRSVHNYTDYEFDTNIIASDMRHQLMEYSGGRIRFVERTRAGASAETSTDILVERELKNEGVYDLSKEEPLAGVDFFLKGEIRAHTVGAGGKQDCAIWYYCWLVDAENGELVWEHRYGPIRKVG